MSPRDTIGIACVLRDSACYLTSLSVCPDTWPNDEMAIRKLFGGLKYTTNLTRLWFHSNFKKGGAPISTVNLDLLFDTLRGLVYIEQLSICLHVEGPPSRKDTFVRCVTKMNALRSIVLCFALEVRNTNEYAACEVAMIRCFHLLGNAPPPIAMESVDIGLIMSPTYGAHPPDSVLCGNAHFPTILVQETFSGWERNGCRVVFHGPHTTMYQTMLLS